MSERIDKIANETALKIATWQDKRQSAEFHIPSDTAFRMLKEDISLAIKEAVKSLTSEEVHNLCHDLEKTVSLEGFNQGCKNYQKKLFGRCAGSDKLFQIIEECRGSHGTGDYWINQYIYRLKKKLIENGIN